MWDHRGEKQQASTNYQGHGMWERSQFQIAKYSIHQSCSFIEQFNGEYKSYKNICSRRSKCLSHLPSAFISKFKGYFSFERFCSVEQAQITYWACLGCQEASFRLLTTGQLTDKTPSSLTYALENLTECTVLTASPSSSVWGRFNCPRGKWLLSSPPLVSFFPSLPSPRSSVSWNHLHIKSLGSTQISISGFPA